MRSYLTYRDEKSSKFWEITVDGASHTVRYGRIGTNGRTLTKEFDSVEEARKSAEELIQSKRKKGYIDEAQQPNLDPFKEMFALVRDQDEPVDERAAKLQEYIEEGADPNITRDRWLDAAGDPIYPAGETLLHYAVDPQRPPEPTIIRTLLECGADPNADGYHSLPLDVAIARGQMSTPILKRVAQTIRLLAAAGARSNLPLARLGGADPVVVDALIEVGFELDEVDEDGNTLLHVAVSRMNEFLVLSLLERGARADVTNALGLTPRALANNLRPRSEREEGKKGDILALLADVGAPLRVDLKASEGCTPCDTSALRAAAEERGGLERFGAFLERDFVSFQQLASEIHGALGDGDPSTALDLLAVCDFVLGDGSTRRFDGDQQLRKPFFHHGDVEIEGSLIINDAFLVTGELRVKTTVCDCGPDSYVVIGGDVHAGAVYTDGEFYVGGDLRAEQFVYGHYNDNILVASTVHAPLVIADDHAIHAEFDAEHVFEYEDYDPGRAIFRELLVDACFDEDGVSSTKLIEVVDAGDTIFRA